ncbi:MAG: glycoside hydrolase family 16 protein [Bacteroidota bacterium]
MKWRNPKIIYPAFLFALIFAFSSCIQEADIIEGDWQLVWQDEFDGPANQLPDANKWNFDVGRGPGNDGWGNQELQYYTDRAENASLDGEGNMVITARAESFAGASFTSARITTKGKFDFGYGRYEARIRIPSGPGLWPAFWMLGTNIDLVGWPQCGEIDIMESRGQFPQEIQGTVHGPGYSAGESIGKPFTYEQSRFDDDFHIYAVEWGPDYIYFFVDDVLYQAITPEDVPGEWVFNTDFHMLLNVAVGGTYVGFPSVDTPFPQTMHIDYVRVYENASN